jgi:hypothetical protein
MRLARLLDLDTIHSVDPSFAELIEDTGTRILQAAEADGARLVVDEEEVPLALALSTRTGWQITHFVFRNPTLEILERFEQLEGDIYQEKREEYLSSLREYYSRELIEQVIPAVEDVPPDRISVVEDLLQERWGRHPHELCLDSCCGSGIGSSALRSQGMQPLAYDHDPALLSLGLHSGRLRADSTMWIDGTRATLYCQPVQYGAAFMLGEIHSFNEDVWQRIVEELITLAREVLITTGTEREAQVVAAWCRRSGRSTTVDEHAADPVYERWVCQVS